MGAVLKLAESERAETAEMESLLGGSMLIIVEEEQAAGVNALLPIMVSHPALLDRKIG